MSSLELEVTELRLVKKQNEKFCAKNNDYSHIFTSPKLMQEIHNSLKNIAIKRGVSK